MTLSTRVNSWDVQWGRKYKRSLRESQRSEPLSWVKRDINTYSLQVYDMLIFWGCLSSFYNLHLKPLYEKMSISYTIGCSIDISDNQELFGYKIFLKNSFIILCFLSHYHPLCFVPFRTRISRKIRTCCFHGLLILSLPAHHSLEIDLRKVLVNNASDQIHQPLLGYHPPGPFWNTHAADSMTLHSHPRSMVLFKKISVSGSSCFTDLSNVEFFKKCF